jgi:molybdopterin converting factor small subunit
MIVSIRVPAILRDCTSGRAVVAVEVPDGSTIGDVFDELATQSPALERRVRDEHGVVRRHVNVFVGDTNVRDAALMATPAEADTQVLILPCVSGG